MKDEWKTICTSTYSDTQYMDLDLGVRLYKETAYDMRGNIVSVSITAINFNVEDNISLDRTQGLS